MGSLSFSWPLQGLGWIGGAALALGSCSGTVRPSQATGGDAPDEVGPVVAAVVPTVEPQPVATAVPSAPRGPHLVAPSVVSIPYVVAGQGGAAASIAITNDGDAPLTGITWSLSGDPSLTIGAAPSALGPGDQGSLQITWTGSPTETIVQASLSLAAPGVAAEIPVFAVAGDPGLGPVSWESVEGAGGVIVGLGATVAMPAAPFPDGASKYTDPSVRVFVPESYRDRGAQDLVLHFHGWNSTLPSTLATHLYQQHLYASGSNAVLVVPQGPVDAPSGDFGKLMARGGVSRLLTEVLVLLYREQKIVSPVRGDFVVTSHSGGYQAVAATLDPTNLAPRPGQIDLYDSLYGYEAVFELFALGGGVLRSNYGETGGTLDLNQTVASYLGQKGMKVATEVTRRALASDAPVIDFAGTSHDGMTRTEGAYGEHLRWKLRHSRRGPRVELRTATVASGGSATVQWLSPADEDLKGFVVEQSADGHTWTSVATAGPTATSATFPLSSGGRVRVKPVTAGVAPANALASDGYRVDPGASVLVVDGFDRILDGSFGGLRHDFAALVGEALGPVATVSHRAVTEDGFDLTRWRSVVWLLGDTSTADVSLSAAEQTALRDYLGGGGHLVMSGSDLGYDLAQTPAGADFLEQCFGAVFVSDDAASHEAAGQGPLGFIPSFAVGGAGAPYALASPDVLGAVSGGVVLLEYGSGDVAAVGRPGKSAYVAFPLELTAKGPSLAALTRALLSFAGGS